MNNKQANKDLAISFLKLAASGQVDEAFDKYIDQDFIHHNQYFKGDRNSLLNAMKESHLKMSNRIFDTKFVLEDKDKVVTYSYVEAQSGELRIAVVHILQFVNQKIVEMWDVGQLIDKNSPNENGMF